MPKYNPNANIHSFDELMIMERSVELLIVDNDVCNGKRYTILDLSSFSNLKEFEVGDYSCTFVNEVKMIGLNRLERVVIGMNSFRECFQKNPNRHFYLKNCERLRELKMGCYSFSDYSVCEIENVPSLEVIEMDGHNYEHASLELESDSQRMK